MNTDLVSPALLNTVAFPLFIVEGNTLRYTNAAAQRLLGYSSEALTQCHFSDLIDPEFHPLIFASYPRTDLAAVHNVEIRLLSSDSRPVWVDFSAVRLESQNQPPNQDVWVITAFDITQHKLAAAAARERESAFRLAADNFPGAFAIYDANLRFQYVNKYGTQTTGRSIEEYVGHTDDEIFPPSITDAFLPTLWRTRELRTPQVVECKLDLAAGNVDFVVKYVPLLDEHGQIKQILGITHDITERKQVEEALRQSEQRYRQLLDNVPVSISVTDLENLELLYVNRACAALFQVNAPDPDAYHRWAQSLSPEQQAISKARIQQLREGLTVPPVEYHLRLPDGRDLHTIAEAILITYQGQRAILTINTDITESKRAEQHALELIMERERRGVLEQLLQDTSHDLRTPLASLMTSSYLVKRLIDTLRDQVDTLPESTAVGVIRHTANAVTDRIEVHRHSIVRLKMLVEAMFDMIRLDTQIDFEFLPHNLNNFVQPIINEQFLEAQKQKLKLSFDPDESLPSVSLDGYEFSRVVQNLIENAIHYTPEGGQITVRTYRQNGDVVLEVADTGIGIDASDLPHIFERFFRADRARSARTGGNGLGLAITRKIVEAHGGRIEVSSVLGQGSTFRVILSHS